jgi:hypothetical protein
MRFAIVAALLALSGAALGLLAGNALSTYTDQAQNAANTFATAPCFSADTGLRDPSAQAADSGGNGNGFELDPANALGDGAGYASNINNSGTTGGDRHRFYQYAISFTEGCTVKGIEVRLDWWLDNLAGAQGLDVELSWDGGTSWTSAKSDPTESKTEHTGLLGGSADTWGRAWTAADLSDANFRVRLTCKSTNNIRDFFLDWVPVRVYYGP